MKFRFVMRQNIKAIHQITKFLEETEKIVLGSKWQFLSLY